MTDPLTPTEALIRIVDKRTPLDDGWWISQREMRYAEEALAASHLDDWRERLAYLERERASLLVHADQLSIHEWDYVKEQFDRPIARLQWQIAQETRAAEGKTTAPSL